MRLGLGLGLARLGKAIASFVRDGLKLYYPFKDNSPDFLLDGSTSFSGSSQYIDCGTGLGNALGDNYAGDLTVSMWFKADVTSGDDGMFEIGNFTNSGTGDFALRMKSNTLSWMVNAVRRIDVSYTNTSSWSHVVGVYDSRGADFTKLYLNGESVGTPTGTFPSASDIDLSGLKTTIGGYYGSPYTFDGKIANVGIWNRALSASEVESIYWRGSHSELKDTELTNLISWYNLSSAGLGAEVISNGTMEAVSTNTSLPNYQSFPEDWTSAYGTLSIQERSSAQAFAGTHSLLFKTNASSRSGVAQAFTVTGSVSYRLEFYVYGVTGNTIQITHQTGSGTASTLDGGGTLLDYEQGVRIGEWDKITLDFTTSGSGTVTGTVLQLGSNVSGNSYYIDNVSLKRIGAGAPDSQGNNDGTIEGATTNSDSYSGESPFKPRIQDKATPKMAVQLADGSTSFDGTDDYIELPTFSDTTALSVAGWIYLDSSFSGRVYFINSGDFDLNVDFFSTTGEMRVNRNNALHPRYTNIPTSQWVHLAITTTNKTADPLVYFNGSLQSGTGNTDYGTLLGSGTFIGQSGSGNYFKGKMANVAIYSATLTQTQIQDLMFTERYQNLSADLKTNLVSWYDMGSRSLGVEQINNRDFSDLTGWVFHRCSSSVSNGQLTITKNASGGDQNVYRQDLSVPAKSTVIFSVYVKNGSSGNTPFLVRIFNDSFGQQGSDLSGTSSSEWVQYEKEIHATDGVGIWYFRRNTSSDGDIMIKEPTLKIVSLDDSEGTNEGAPVGTTTNTGYIHSPHGVVDPLNFGEVYSGRALSFDGSNDHVTLSKPDYMNGESAFTISAWALHDDTGSDVIITTDSELFMGYNSGKLTASYRETDNTRNRKVATDVLNSGELYHLCATWDKNGDGEIKLYVNGYYVAQSYNDGGASTASVIKNGTSARVGAWVTGSQEMDGKLSSIKVFNTALTQDQVRELYTKPETVLPTGVSASNLKLDLPMQEKAGSIIYDGSGNQNHGTITGATFVSGQEYGYQASLVRSNTPIIFDGSNDFVSCGNIGIRSYPFTYSAWFRTNGTTKNTICALADADQNVPFYQFLITNTGLARINARNTSDDFCDSSGTYNDGKWHHGVAVFTSATDRKIYIDGVADGSDTSSVPFSSAIDEFGIGVLNRSSKADYYDDDINEVAVWDVALDADAVSALYNSGVPLLPTSDSGNYDNSDSLMGYWRNDGKLTWNDRANTGYASFDDSDDQITFSDSSALTFGTTDFTASAWVYVNDLDNKLGVLGSETNGFGLFVETDGTISSTKTNIVGESKSTGTVSTKNWHHIAYTRVYSTGGSASLGTYYIDGVASGTTIDNNNYTVVSKYIGRIQSTNRFDGKIAGCNYFSIPLTASEISELYAIGKRTSISGHSQFSNCVGSWLMGAGTGDTESTIQDQTSNNNDGTVSGASIIGYNDGTVSGNPVKILIPEGSTEGRDSQGYYLSDTTSTSNNGLRMYGGSEIIHIQDSNIFHLGTQDFTFELWAKYNETSTTRGLFNYFKDVNNRYHFAHYTNLEFYSNLGGSAQSTATTHTRDLNWHHYVITKESNTMKIYVDTSVIVTNSSFTQNINYTGGIFYIGVRTDNGSDFSSFNVDGAIDEFRIYHKALSLSEITKNYNSGKSAHQ